MVERIRTTGQKAELIHTTGAKAERIEPSEVAAALGAIPIGEPHSSAMDPISLAALGADLIRRLRSSGGRPALADATQKVKVPLSSEDILAIEQIISAIEGATGSKPSLGQIASVIVRLHIDELKKSAGASA